MLASLYLTRTPRRSGRITTMTLTRPLCCRMCEDRVHNGDGAADRMCIAPNDTWCITWSSGLPSSTSVSRVVSCTTDPNNNNNNNQKKTTPLPLFNLDTKSGNQKPCDGLALSCHFAYGLTVAVNPSAKSTPSGAPAFRATAAPITFSWSTNAAAPPGAPCHCVRWLT